MAVVRATALSHFPELVRSLGGDPDELLNDVGVDPSTAGSPDVFIPLATAVAVLEKAAGRTSTPDLGRRLAALQGIEILGPVGVAARTAGTVGEALQIFERFLAAYSPGLGLRVYDLASPGRSFLEYRILDSNVRASPQHAEMALGVVLRVLRHLLGDLYRPQKAHLPHRPLVPAAAYRDYYGCVTQFDQVSTGLTVRSADLRRPLQGDTLAHEAVVSYLSTIVENDTSTTASVQALLRQILPTGRANLDLVAKQLSIHPKALQRRLAAEGTTFADTVDGVRRDTAERLLRDTRITMAHLARELGYAEQTVLTRSCHRWFGTGPAAHRKALRGP